MSSFRLFAAGLVTFCALFIQIASAEDVDLYNPNPSIVGSGKPNILFFLDNAAANNGNITQLDGSGGKKLELIRQVMNLLLDPQPGTQYPPECGANAEEVLAKIKGTRMGLMQFREDSKSAKGGYVRSHIRDMADDANRLALLAKINNPGGTTTQTCVTEAATCASGGYPTDAECTDNDSGSSTTTADECGQCSTWTKPPIVDSVTNITCSNIKLNGCDANKGRQISTTTNLPVSRNVCTTTQAPSGIPNANNAPYGKTMWEAYQYYSGLDAYVGFTGDTAGTAYDPDARIGNTNTYNKPGDAGTCSGNHVVVLGTGGPDSAEEGDTATLLTSAGLCADTSAITYPSGVNTTYQSNNLDEFARRMTGTTAPATCVPTGNRPKITTHAIMLRAEDDAQPPILSAQQNLVNASQGVGGGNFQLASDGQAFLKAICKTINDTQAVNSAFAAVTLPVSANVTGTNLNQVYMGVFRPDPNNYPRWMGNLKQYAIGKDPSSSVQNPVYGLVDTNGNIVTNPASGFVKDTANSFWTTASTYWDPNKVSDKKTSDSPDGPLVEKGGAAQKLRSAFDAGTARNLYTCFKAGGSCATDTDLSAADVNTKFLTGGVNPLLTPAKLDVADEAARDLLVAWMRGLDNNSPVENTNPNKGSSTVRPSIHGDVLHSRPAVVHYNRAKDDNDVYVFYGANDGVYRAIKGGQGANDGREAWGIVFEEFLPKLKRLRSNDPLISAPNDRKTYFADGSTTFYRLDANNDGELKAAEGDKVWLFVSVRRGGRFLYAFDVSDPEKPKYMWSKGCPNDTGTTGCSTGYEELGQTWSTPFVTALNVASGTGAAKTVTKTPVLIFGGGYDKAVEDLPQESITGRSATSVTTGTGATAISTNRTMGRAIYIVDASSGNVLLSIGGANSYGSPDIVIDEMDYAIPSDVQVLQRLRGTPSDGVVDRIYVGDTGGNVWRVSVAEEVTISSQKLDKALFKVSRLAGVGTAANAGSPSGYVDRKFLYPPDVVFAEDSGGLYDAVLIGSGDRESPLSLVASDAFYMFKDREVARLGVVETAIADTTSVDNKSGDLYDLKCTFSRGDGTVPSTDPSYVTLPRVTSCPATNPTDLAARNGWKFALVGKGERVIGSALTASGLTLFATNTPPDYSANQYACSSSLGEATIYNINYSGLVDPTNESSYPSNLVASSFPADGTTTAQGLLPSPVRVVVKIDGKTVELVLFGTNPIPPKGVTYDRRIKKYWYKKIEPAK